MTEKLSGEEYMHQMMRITAVVAREVAHDPAAMVAVAAGLVARAWHIEGEPPLEELLQHVRELAEAHPKPINPVTRNKA